MANTRFTLSTIEAEIEQIVRQHPQEANALEALSELASSKGLRFNQVRRAYRAVHRLQNRRKPIV